MKKMLLPAGLALALTVLPWQAQAQTFTLQNTVLPNPDNEPAAVHPVPSERQLLWQETEFYAFFHFGMNTFTGKEWGFGDEDVNIFAPTAVPNPRQWVETAKKAHMRGGIAVVKHHDGFCLWPTQTTTHNCTSSSSANAQATNIPRDFAAASKDLGMKYGFYISPWDRNSAHYGRENYVRDVFLKQCFEISEYGSDQFEMWFDGANGGNGYYGGARDTRSIDSKIYYDMPNLRDSVHKVAPNCVMWGVGGEARWIGNEAGWAGETNWSTQDREAGERNNMYGDINGYYWKPGESDAKATNRGWFWHEGEGVLSPERLFQMYLETVGRNATLILNLPPDRSGTLPQATVTAMENLGNLLTQRLSNDLAKTATVEVSTQRSNGASRTYAATNLTDGDKDTYWATPDGVTEATITFSWPTEQTLHYVDMMEYIRKGQRVKSFTIETSTDGQRWTQKGGAIQKTTIGYKRIIPLNGSTTNSYDAGTKARFLRITIKDSKACPLLHTVSVF